MNRKQRADEMRLLAAIEHWKRMRKAEFVDHPAERPDACQCALCMRYLCKLGWCSSCPIRAHTKQEGCAGTPFEDASRWFWTCVHHVRKRTDGIEPVMALVEWKDHSLREIRFLRRVLAKLRAGKL